MKRKIARFLLSGIFCIPALGQNPQLPSLPSAPQPQTAPASPASPQAPGEPLTLQEAENLAIKNNPQISIAKLLTLAQHQVVREARSYEMPSVTGALTAVEPHDGSRITAGGLNNPIIFERASGGVTIGQVITDFGRTRNLVATEQWREHARTQDERATAAEITLAVDRAFYDALTAQGTLEVARQTVEARQTTVDQVQALAAAKLKSDLDLSFAKVNLAQAQLLLLDTENRVTETLSGLNALLGFEKQRQFRLIDPASALAPPPGNPEGLVAQALQSRPDLAALNEQWTASQHFARAEHDLRLPTISALAAYGGAPVRDDRLQSWYGAAGVNVSIPLFNGFLFSARAQAASFQSDALHEQVRDLRDRISRDVRTTALQAATSYQRVAVAGQLLQQANMALDLAQTRYKLGLGSIVELSQAQLQQTEASIDSTAARYQSLSAMALLNYQTGK